MNDGIITGSDMHTCICCGGLMITFTDNPQPYAAEYKLIENGTDLGITAQDQFPLYVKVDWKTDMTGYCRNIIITRITRK